MGYYIIQSGIYEGRRVEEDRVREVIAGNDQNRLTDYPLVNIGMEQPIFTWRLGPLHQDSEEWIIEQVVEEPEEEPEEEPDNYCLVCGCSDGEFDCDYSRPCSECHHWKCGDCATIYPNSDEYSFEYLICFGCVPDDDENPSYDEMEKNCVYHQPFHYHPKYLYDIVGNPPGHEVWRVLNNRAQDELERTVEIHYMSHGNQPILWHDYGPFDHYHGGCWGTANYTLGDRTFRQLTRDLERSLEVINLSSLAHIDPYYLLSSLTLVEGEYSALCDDPTSGWTVPQPVPTNLVRQELLPRLGRQASLGLAVPQQIIIAGIGGVGWQVARMAALVGVQRLVVVEKDVVEEVNGNRLDIYPGWVGQSKTSAIRGRLYALGVQIESFDPPNSIADTGWRDILNNSSVIIDCTDNLRAQHFYYRCAQAHGLRYIRAGYDGGMHITVTSKRAPDWDFAPETGYTVPAWIAGAELAATFALIKLVKQPELEVCGNILNLLREVE